MPDVWGAMSNATPTVAEQKKALNYFGSPDQMYFDAAEGASGWKAVGLYALGGLSAAGDKVGRMAFDPTMWAMGGLGLGAKAAQAASLTKTAFALRATDLVITTAFTLPIVGDLIDKGAAIPFDIAEKNWSGLAKDVGDFAINALFLKGLKDHMVETGKGLLDAFREKPAPKPPVEPDGAAPRSEVKAEPLDLKGQQPSVEVKALSDGVPADVRVPDVRPVEPAGPQAPAVEARAPQATPPSEVRVPQARPSEGGSVIERRGNSATGSA